MESINNEMLKPDFWNNKVLSQNVVKEKKFFEDLINTHNDSVKKIQDFDELYKLAEVEKNQEVLDEIIKNLKDLKI